MEHTAFPKTEIYKLHEIVIRLDDYAKARIFPPLGITYPEFLVLMAAKESVQTTHKDAAALLGMSKSLVSQRVNALERKGLLRQAVNPANRREHRLELSTKGQDVVERAYDALLSASDAVFASLGTQRKTMAGILDRLLDLLRSIERSSPPH